MSDTEVRCDDQVPDERSNWQHVVMDDDGNEFVTIFLQPNARERAQAYDVWIKNVPPHVGGYNS